MHSALNSALRSYARSYAHNPVLATCKPILSACALSSASTNAPRAAVLARCLATEAAAPAGNGSTSVKPFRNRTRISDIKGRPDEGASLAGNRFEVRGWVRTLRDQKAFAFVELNDGSTLAGLQVVIDPETEGYDLLGAGSITTGCSISAHGELVQSPGGKQAVELKASKIVLIGACDPATYPLQKKRHTLEFLRGIAHLRPRTNTLSAVMRVRSALAQATHEFFRTQGFLYVHTPLISASDCEGAGEMFQVTTLLSRLEGGAPAAPGSTPAPSIADLEKSVSEQGSRVSEAKAQAKESATDDDKAAAKDAVTQLLALKGQLATAQEGAAAKTIPMGSDGDVDYSQDFFGQRAYLAVSGQLNGEMCACALGDVYTFGPTFRAENSNTSRHLAEFWMIEPEMAFADLQDDMACAEAYLKHCVNYVLTHCSEDLAFFDSRVEKGLLARLQAVVAQPFATITYTQAVDILLASDRYSSFEFPVSWGCDLQSEHERYLTEVEFAGVPLIVTDYPKGIKAFYMRLNDDGKTVAAMDLLVPRVGELMGGSQREDRLDVLEARMREVDLEPEEYKPYLDLRRYGSVPHAGFGLGFERLVQFCSGVENIRDVIPFPRYPGHAEF